MLNYLRITGLLLMVLFTSVGFAQNDSLKLGLVLSGGGAKGFAHIGVLKVLEEEGIPVSLITGTSIGSLVGGLYALGYSAKELEELAKQQNWENLLSDGVPRTLKSAFKQNYEQKYLLELGLNQEKKRLTLPSGLIHGNNALTVLSGFMANLPEEIDFTTLPIPYACVAYSLDSGEEVVLNQGRLPRAILSSMAIPGVFSPVKYQGMHLLDGGILNNFPVDVALDMGADLIIGVDLKQDYQSDPEFESITDIFQEIVGYVMSEKHIENASLADVIIHPELEGISTLDFETELIDSIIKLGEKAARKKLPIIKELLAGEKIIDNNQNKEIQKKTSWYITEIEIPWKYDEEASFILNKLNLPLNTNYSVEDFRLAVTRLFAYGNFQQVYYTLHPNETGYSFKLHINQKKEMKMMLGLGLNTTDVSGFYFNYSQQSYSNIISLLTVDAKFAFNPQINIHLESLQLLFSIQCPFFIG